MPPHLAHSRLLLIAAKIVAHGAAVTLILAAFASVAFENTYIRSAPRRPISEEGKTVPFATKGITIYITPEQRDLLAWLNWITVRSGVVLVFVVLAGGKDVLESHASKRMK